MNIAILVKEFPPNVIGGTETQTKRMATEIQRQTDHDVTVYTKSYSGGEELNPEFNLMRIPNWQINSFISTLTFICMAFVYLLRDHRKYDLLQCMMIYPNGFVGYLIHHICGLPYFAWIRGGDYYFMKDISWKRGMIKRVLSDTLVLVQTERIKHDVHSEFPDSTLHVLGNGVGFPEQRADGDKIVFVGRLKKQKGVDLLLRAASNMGEDLLIVGNGPQREALETLAKELDASATFVGWVDPDSVGTYLQRAKMFVLPSVDGEGLPNALLEAYAYGLPVVATDTGGVSNVIIDGKTGLLVEPGSVSALLKKIDLISEDPKLCDSMGQNARNYVEHNHSWPHIIEKMQDVYDNLSK
jgi:glycosyltransferase involved in cell wall biosynthesis